MATTTTNYGLTKPSYGDNADIAVINSNMDKIDAKMKEIEDAGGGGGGSSVEWNQIQTSGTKIAEVTIDGSMKEVYAPTGGSSGGVNATIDNLYSSTAFAENIELPKNIIEYDIIIIQGADAQSSGNKYISGNLYEVDSISFDGKEYIGANNDGCNIWYKIESANKLVFANRNSGTYIITNIYGIKFSSSGGGGSYSETVLYDYREDNGGNICYDTTTQTLRDDIENYDLLCLEFASSAGDLTNADWNSTNELMINVNSLSNGYNPNYISFTSFDDRSSRHYIKGKEFKTTIRNKGNTNGLIRMIGIKF